MPIYCPVSLLYRTWFGSENGNSLYLTDNQYVSCCCPFMVLENRHNSGLIRHRIRYSSDKIGCVFFARSHKYTVKILRKFQMLHTNSIEYPRSWPTTFTWSCCSVPYYGGNLLWVRRNLRAHSRYVYYLVLMPLLIPSAFWLIPSYVDSLTPWSQALASEYLHTANNFQAVSVWCWFRIFWCAITMI